MGISARTEHLVSHHVCLGPSSASPTGSVTSGLCGIMGHGEEFHQRQRWKSRKSIPGKVTLLSWALNSQFKAHFAIELPFDPLAPSFVTARGGPWGTPCRPAASVPLTLGFHVIHHRARGLHDHVTWSGASSCVVHSPQGEPGREGRVLLSERAGGPADSRALPGWREGLLAAVTTLQSRYCHHPGHKVCRREPLTASRENLGL